MPTIEDRLKVLCENHKKSWSQGGLNLPSIKQLLKYKGLSIAGNRKALVERLCRKELAAYVYGDSARNSSRIESAKAQKRKMMQQARKKKARKKTPVRNSSLIEEAKAHKRRMIQQARKKKKTHTPWHFFPAGEEELKEELIMGAPPVLLEDDDDGFMFAHPFAESPAKRITKSKSLKKASVFKKGGDAPVKLDEVWGGYADREQFAARPTKRITKSKTLKRISPSKPADLVSFDDEVWFSE